MGIGRRYILQVGGVRPSGATVTGVATEFNLLDAFSGEIADGTEVQYDAITTEQLGSLSENEYRTRVEDFLTIVEIQEDGAFQTLLDRSEFNSTQCDSAAAVTTVPPTTVPSTTTTTAFSLSDGSINGDAGFTVTFIINGGTSSYDIELRGYDFLNRDGIYSNTEGSLINTYDYISDGEKTESILLPVTTQVVVVFAVDGNGLTDQLSMSVPAITTTASPSVTCFNENNVSVERELLSSLDVYIRPDSSIDFNISEITIDVIAIPSKGTEVYQVNVQPFNIGNFWVALVGNSGLPDDIYDVSINLTNLECGTENYVITVVVDNNAG
jgi:hypothetical protein